MPEANVLVVRYVEVSGTDPQQVTEACEKLGLRGSGQGGLLAALPEASKPPAAAEVKDDPAKEDPPKKRGRGRPRKVADETGEAEAAPKKRGRPRKAEAEDAEPPKKRGRGRPRKSRPAESEPPPKRKAEPEPPEDEDEGEGDDGDDFTYDDIIIYLNEEKPRRIGHVVEALFTEFGYEKPADIAAVLESIRKDSSAAVRKTDYWAILKRLCPDGDDDQWLDDLKEAISPHLEAVLGRTDED